MKKVVVEATGIECGCTATESFIFANSKYILDLEFCKSESMSFAKSGPVHPEILNVKQNNYHKLTYVLCCWGNEPSNGCKSPRVLSMNGWCWYIQAAELMLYILCLIYSHCSKIERGSCSLWWWIKKTFSNRHVGGLIPLFLSTKKLSLSIYI